MPPIRGEKSSGRLGVFVCAASAAFLWAGAGSSAMADVYAWRAPVDGDVEVLANFGLGDPAGPVPTVAPGVSDTIALSADGFTDLDYTVRFSASAAYGDLFVGRAFTSPNRDRVVLAKSEFGAATDTTLSFLNVDFAGDDTVVRGVLGDDFIVNAINTTMAFDVSLEQNLAWTTDTLGFQIDTTLGPTGGATHANLSVSEAVLTVNDVNGVTLRAEGPSPTDMHAIALDLGLMNLANGPMMVEAAPAGTTLTPITIENGSALTADRFAIVETAGSAYGQVTVRVGDLVGGAFPASLRAREGGITLGSDTFYPDPGSPGDPNAGLADAVLELTPAGRLNSEGTVTVNRSGRIDLANGARMNLFPDDPLTQTADLVVDGGRVHGLQRVAMLGSGRILASNGATLQGAGPLDANGPFVAEVSSGARLVSSTDPGALPAISFGRVGQTGASLTVTGVGSEVTAGDATLGEGTDPADGRATLIVEDGGFGAFDQLDLVNADVTVRSGGTLEVLDVSAFGLAVRNGSSVLVDGGSLDATQVARLVVDLAVIDYASGRVAVSSRPGFGIGPRADTQSLRSVQPGNAANVFTLGNGDAFGLDVGENTFVTLASGAQLGNVGPAEVNRPARVHGDLTIQSGGQAIVETVSALGVVTLEDGQLNVRQPGPSPSPDDVADFEGTLTGDGFVDTAFTRTLTHRGSIQVGAGQRIAFTDGDPGNPGESGAFTLALEGADLLIEGGELSITGDYRQDGSSTFTAQGTFVPGFDARLLGANNRFTPGPSEVRGGLRLGVDAVETAGHLTVENGAAVSITNELVIELTDSGPGPDAGVTVEAGGELVVIGLLLGGGVDGAGTLEIRGDFVPGNLGFNRQFETVGGGGDLVFTDTAALTLGIELETPGVYRQDRVDANTSATLAGDLVINLGASDPLPETPLTLLSAPILAGVFDTVTVNGGLPSDPGRVLAVTYTASAVLAQEALLGDANLNDQVEQGDLNAVLTNWGASNLTHPAADVSWVAGDFNGDGAVDQSDLNAVLTNWGSTAPPSFQGFAVPEPALAAPLLGLLAASRRRCGR